MIEEPKIRVVLADDHAMLRAALKALLNTQPDIEVSGRGESHPSALAELCRNLSAHTAPIVQPSGRTPSRQCANSFGSRLATLTSHRLVRRSWPYNPFVFPLGPSNEILVDASKKWIQHRLVEASVIVDPPLHHFVEHVGKVTQSLVTALVDPPAPQLSTHRFDSVVTHRRQEIDKELASLAFREARTKRVPQEIKSLVGIGSSAICVLAVHDARLVWMQLQATLRQPSGDSVSNKLSLRLTDAVNNHIVAVPLEPRVREP